MKNNLRNVIKYTVLFIALALFALITIYLFPVVIKLGTEEGRIAFREKVNESSYLGFIFLALLEIAQIIVPIIPGEPMEFLSGLMYGPIWGTLFLLICISIISIFIFILVRRYGKKVICLFIKEEKVDKFLNKSFFENKKRINYILLLLFMIPGTPKDLIIYVAGLLNINFWYFLLIATIGRLPSILSSTLAGANVAKGNFIVSILIYIITFAIVFLIVFIMNKFDKDKMAQKILKDTKED